MIKRRLEEVFKDKLFSGKALILLGARQVGKTTLLNDLVYGQADCLWLNGDELDVQKMFENTSADRLKAQFGNNKIVVIDEAQRIRDIGLRLKLITDQMKDIQLIATGSSAFELANEVNEPLFYLFLKWFSITDLSRKRGSCPNASSMAIIPRW